MDWNKNPGDNDPNNNLLFNNNNYFEKIFQKTPTDNFDIEIDDYFVKYDNGSASPNSICSNSINNFNNLTNK